MQYPNIALLTSHQHLYYQLIFDYERQTFEKGLHLFNHPSKN